MTKQQDAPRVIITILGGVAQAEEIPDGIEVEIRDYDNGEEIDTTNPDNDTQWKKDKYDVVYTYELFRGPTP